MLIGISGGIGSGKSLVSRILRLRGFRVYDCDIEARRMMEGSEVIKQRIRDEISPDVTDGISAPDRKLLAEIVFNNERARIKLNEITHGAMRQQISGLAVEATSTEGSDVIFVEAAVLAESGLAEMCDRIWLVTADVKERLRRVMERDHCSRAHAESRMRSQRREEELLANFKEKTSVIYNDDNHSILAQIEALLN